MLEYSDTLPYQKIADFPFEIPAGWEWVRLGDVSTSIQYGLSNSAETSGNYKLLRITDIQDNKVDWNNVPYTTITDEQATDFHLDVGDIVFARTGATVGKSYIISSLPVSSVFASYLIRVKTTQVCQKYIKFFFECELYWEQIIDKSVGTGQPNVNGTKLKELILPLPPISEQHRIASIIESAFAVIDEIEHNKSDIETTIIQTKSKILDMAIRGVLAKQDPNDEPACILLQKIATLRGKTSSDTAPYQKLEDLPIGWAITKLGIIADIYTGNSISEQVKSERYENLETGYDYIGTKDVGFDNEITYENSVKIPFDEKGFKYSYPGSTLLCIEGGSSGRKIGILNKQVCFGNKLCSFNPIGINPKYLYYFLQSDNFKHLFRENHTGLIGGVSVTKLKDILIPIPPLAEQDRIVKTIDKAFKSLDSIMESLN